MAISLEVNTKPYLNTHGHEPRGTGSWWFQVLDNIFCYQKTSYSRAVAAVKREVRQQQQNLGYAPSITLLP